MDISVVIVSWNAADRIRRCLKSINAQTFKEFETIVVDNGSEDVTTEIIRNKFPWVKLIERHNNEGFGGANNVGILASSGRYVITLNDDLILDKDFIKNLVDAIRSAPTDIGMVACRMLRSGTNLIDSTGLVLSKTRRFYDRGSGEKDTGQFNETSYVFGPCAGAALYKRDLLEEIKHEGGYFDADFFLLIEDFDIAWRAQIKGWKSIYAPAAICFHDRGISRKKSDYLQFLSFRNRYYLIIKNEDVVNLLIDLPRFIIYDIPKLVFMLLKNPLFFRALSDLIANRKKLLSKRRHAREGRKASPKYIRNLMV